MELGETLVLSKTTLSVQSELKSYCVGSYDPLFYIIIHHTSWTQLYSCIDIEQHVYILSIERQYYSNLRVISSTPQLSWNHGNWIALGLYPLCGGRDNDRS